MRHSQGTCTSTEPPGRLCIVLSDLNMDAGVITCSLDQDSTLAEHSRLRMPIAPVSVGDVGWYLARVSWSLSRTSSPIPFEEAAFSHQRGGHMRL